MRVYYAVRISPHISRTPEGFWVCQSVPIARTGVQEYLASELGLEDMPRNREFSVIRTEEEVFSAAAMASFEGKPVTDEHPPDLVTSDNANEYMKGCCKNVRRGEGEDADKLMADLVIYDQRLIDEIESGKREVSCGYDCTNILEADGNIYQRDIKGNHVAIVSAGRAGANVAIRDAKPKQNHYSSERRKHMSIFKTKKPTETDIPRSIAYITSMTKDASPEDVADAVGALADALLEGKESDDATAAQPALPAVAANPASNVPPSAADEDADLQADNELLTLFKAFLPRFEALEAKVETMCQPHDEDPLKKIEDELEAMPTEPAAMDEDMTVEEETTQDEESIIAPPEDRPESILSKDAALKYLREVKPVIAAMKDPQAKKIMTDSLVKLIRAGSGTDKRIGTNPYKAIAGAKQHNAVKRMADSRTKNAPVFDEADIGKRIRDAYNPHYRKDVK